MLYLQNEVEAGYCEAEETQRQLYLSGKIMYVHRNQITFKLKGVFLDRIFSLLRDKRVPKVHGRTLCEIFSSIRANN